MQIIESVISDISNIWKLENPTRQIVVDAYVKSLGYSHSMSSLPYWSTFVTVRGRGWKKANRFLAVCSLASAVLALAMTFFIREVKMR